MVPRLFVPATHNSITSNLLLSEMYIILLHQTAVVIPTNEFIVREIIVVIGLININPITTIISLIQFDVLFCHYSVNIRQGNDVGSQYRTGIYFHSDYQRDAALRSREAVAQFPQHRGKRIETEVMPAVRWWPAEDYHQQYLARGGQCALKGDLTPIRCYG